jgi:hypothetical protein
MFRSSSRWATLHYGFVAAALLAGLSIQPPGAVGAAVPFYIQTVDSRSGVGIYGLVLVQDRNPTGTAHVAYFVQGLTQDTVFYAKRVDAIWKREIVSITSLPSVPIHLALEVDPLGGAHLAFMFHDSGLNADRVAYARRGSAGWTVETVPGSGIYDVHMALDSKRQPHLLLNFSFHELYHYAKTAAGWDIDLVDAVNPAFVYGSSIALDAQDLPRVVFNGHLADSLFYSIRVNGQWTRSFVRTNAIRPSLRIDSQGRARIAFLLDNESLGYLEATGLGPSPSWQYEAPPIPAPIASFDYGLDSQDNPQFVSKDDTSIPVVRYARRSGAFGSSWTVPQSVDVGFTSSGAVQSVGIGMNATDQPVLAYQVDGSEHVIRVADSGVWMHAVLLKQVVSDGVIVLSWAGEGPVSAELSTDGGLSWETLLTGIRTSPVAVRLPAVQATAARIRLKRETDGAIAESGTTLRIVPPTLPPSPIAPQKWSSLGLSNERRGFAVASAGDFNGDGYADEIVGAPLDASSGAFTGRAYIYFGGPGGDGAADRTLQGTFAGEVFGYSVAGAGDLNGDGYDDVAVGAPALGVGTGKVYLFYGGPANGDTTPDLVLNGVQVGEQFGISVCRAGDLNGDGYADLAAGAPFYNVNQQSAGAQGLVRVYLGGPSLDAFSDFGVLGIQANEQLGTSVSGGGDENGDGFADLVAGAPFFDGYAGQDAGRAVVYYGARALDNVPDAGFEGDEAFGHFGASVALAGDMNGDGLADVAVGAPAARSGRGRVTVYVSPGPPDFGTSPGPPDVAPGPPTLEGEAVGDQLGSSVAGVGDLNGDGFADLAIGAPLNDARAFNAGRVYLVPGTTQMDMTPGLVLSGQTSGDRFGIAVAAHASTRCCNFGSLIVGGDQAAAAGATPGVTALYDLSLFKVVSPNGGETWPVGALRDVRWLGSEKADVELSVDGGISWRTLVANCGGQSVNQISLRVPHTPGKFALVRVNPGPPTVNPGPPEINPGPPNGVAVSDSFFTIQTSVALLALLAAPAPTGHGAVLTWNTDPGPADLTGYRIERDNGDGFRTVASLLRETTFADETAGIAARYRLYAVNGLGEEVLVGETSLAPRVPLAAWPLPYRGGPLSIAFATSGGLGGGVGAAQVDLYDVGGRLVRRIARGSYGAGLQAVVWDGQDDHGRTVASGIYFLRASSGGEERKLKVAVLR